MADDEEFEEDVVMEGSELYNVLKEIGRTDFECTPVNRTEFPEDWDEIKNMNNALAPKVNFLLTTCQKIRNIFTRSDDKGDINGAEELELILQLEPLLDDHSSSIQNALDSLDRRSSKKCPALMISTSLLALSLFSKNFKIPGIIITTSLSSLVIHNKYSRARALKNLNDLISTQNEIFNLQKKSLKILRHGYGIKLDRHKSSRKFTDLEIERLKYLQPLCETFTKSMETCSKMFYRTSKLLAEHLPSSAANLMTKFEDNSFRISGEVNYKVLKQFYYTYILVQSEMMNLLAMTYRKNEDTLKLSHIVSILLGKLRIHRAKMSEILQKYQLSRAVSINHHHHKLKKIESSKYQDLYMHVDLLSRKLQNAYGKISSILEEIDNHPNNEETLDFLDSLTLNMNEAYKQIDTARNFAEFNILLINKFRSNKSAGNDSNQINNLMERKEEREREVIFDADPQIIDECFEEYIREEYLRPLCEDDDVSLERAKMDKLLEKNFMSELKGVLMDKYRSMSEREAKALLRYRKSNFDFDGSGGVGEIPPPPPPPPPLSSINEMKREAERRPVPLPRKIDAAPIFYDREAGGNGIIEPIDRFSIKIAMAGRIPAFTTDEETFVGSGENSEEELAGSGCEDDEIID